MMSGQTARFDELRVAVMLLTRLPAGTVPRRVPMATTFWAFPVVGGFVGALVGLVLVASSGLGLPTLAASLLALGAGMALTGGLHEDGLADTADGFGGGENRARKLEIMRDSRIGSYGVCVLVLAIGLRAALLAALVGAASSAATTVLILAALGAASRAALPVLLWALPPARRDGLGHAAGEGRRGTGAFAGGAITALAVAAIVPGGVGLLLGVGLSAFVLARLARRQIGGVTGDVLGATQISAETAGLLVLVVMMANAG